MLRWAASWVQPAEDGSRASGHPPTKLLCRTCGARGESTPGEHLRRAQRPRSAPPPGGHEACTRAPLAEAGWIPGPCTVVAEGHITRKQEPHVCMLPLQDFRLSPDAPWLVPTYRSRGLRVQFVHNES